LAPPHAAAPQGAPTASASWNTPTPQANTANAAPQRLGAVERADSVGVVASVAAVPPRNGTLLRLFFGGLLGIDECRQILADARERAVEQLAVLTPIRQGLEAEIARDPDARFRLITVLAGQHSARAAIAWADESLALLDAA
jgi:hypothetical protein